MHGCGSTCCEDEEEECLPKSSSSSLGWCGAWIKSLMMMNLFFAPIVKTLTGSSSTCKECISLRPVGSTNWLASSRMLLHHGCSLPLSLLLLGIECRWWGCTATNPIKRLTLLQLLYLPWWTCHVCHLLPAWTSGLVLFCRSVRRRLSYIAR